MVGYSTIAGAMCVPRYAAIQITAMSAQYETVTSTIYALCVLRPLCIRPPDEHGNDPAQVPVRWSVSSCAPPYVDAVRSDRAGALACRPSLRRLHHRCLADKPLPLLETPLHFR